jgi:hypothetical protein
VHDMTEHSDHRKYEQRVREHIQHRFLPKGFATSYPPPERWKGFFVGEWLMSMNGGETLDHSRLPVVVLWLTLLVCECHDLSTRKNVSSFQRSSVLQNSGAKVRHAR